MSWRIAVDTGGTFTDLVARHADGRRVGLKVPSTPHDPGVAVRAALAELDARVGSNHGALRHGPLLHGTTVATNAILERTFARAVLVCTAGFEDLLVLRRQARPDLYALHPVVPPPVIPRDRVLGIDARRTATGVVLRALPDLDAWIAQNHATLSTAEAIAICLLHAYAHPQDEHAIARALTAAYPDVPITVSHVLSPVFREYERAATCALNACLAPVMQSYLQRLSANLSARPLHVMSSAGGLMAAHDAARAPVRTALSGPAGGVRGAWAVGRRTQAGPLLAFDMGGTSTDVSVVDGPLMPIDDGAVDGHPLRVPRLAIDTVGAGGGSIASRDAGGGLQVGPRSAGAVPGPACYGRGGRQPTVTDAHVVLGHLDALLGGEMALDVGAARAAVSTLGPVDATARAILELAEATMARACKRVALSQGVDPRGLTLVAFGGAGGLHACGLADALGCKAVIFPVASGVLSAEGILHAPLERGVTRSVFAPESAWTDADIAARVAEAVQAAGPGEVQVLADCRYAGQTHALALDLSAGVPTAMGLRAAFDAAHQARFGHAMDRGVEWVNLRAFARQHPPAFADDRAKSAARRVGPCAIPSYGATLWLPAGWAAERLATGDWRCTRVALRRPDPRLAIEVFRQQITSIAEEMGETLMRAAFSANIKERRDFSCALFDADGQMLAHAAHIPVHLGSTPLSVRAAIDAVPMRAGVSVILNDPFAGGTHLPDVTVVTPVFIDGALRFFVANRAHHADVGGVSAGSLPSPRRADGSVRALTIDDEGIRLPPLALDDAVRARFVAASRVPHEREGDLQAQEAANRHGAARLEALVRRVGTAAIAAASAGLLDYAERRMRATLTALPDGVYRCVDALDDDGVTDEPIPIPVTLTIKGDAAIVDFTAAPDAVAGPLNAVRAIAISATFYCFRCIAGAGLPANAGLMRPITVRTRPGSIVDARPPSAVSSGNVETSQRLVDILFGALAQAAPDRVPAASCGSMNNVLFGGRTPGATNAVRRAGAPPKGVEPEHCDLERSYVHYETLAGGAGAGPLGKGADGVHVHMTNTLNTPIEALEQAYPVRIERYALAEAAGSGAHGDGAHSDGGRGVVRVYRFETDAEVTLMGERRRQGAPGSGTQVRGEPGRHQLIQADGTVVDLPGKCTVAVKAGEAIRVQTPGGGPWRSSRSETRRRE
ncbi:MAG: 5-oxoprolinase (ATP-hydrolyzing) [Bradymonadia bacterium]|jgi:5-oxoprolinase (ATP-hydrolysing)